MERSADIESNEANRSPSIPWVWDYDINQEQFEQILRGQLLRGRLDRTWATVRLLEYAPYSEIVRLLGFDELIRGWPQWRRHLRSKTRIRGFDFLVDWLPKNHGELLNGELLESEGDG